MAEPKRAKQVGIPNRDVGKDLAGSSEGAPEHGTLTAYDLRNELQGRLGWTDDELQQLPVVYGSELVEGDLYLDLDHPEHGELRATDKATINPGCRYVPKRRVPEATWYRLAISAGQEHLPSGNAAPTPGAFGQSSEREIKAGHGGTGAVSEKAMEVEDAMRRKGAS